MAESDDHATEPMTVAEACAIVDAWAPDQVKFGLHEIAYVLRHEAARQDVRIAELLAANNIELERRRAAEEDARQYHETNAALTAALNETRVKLARIRLGLSEDG